LRAAVAVRSHIGADETTLFSVCGGERILKKAASGRGLDARVCVCVCEVNVCGNAVSRKSMERRTDDCERRGAAKRRPSVARS